MAEREKYIRVPRPRWIKPEFFKHEELFDLEQTLGMPARLTFAGLWCQADREGRFVWRPRTLMHDILPYDGLSVQDFGRLMDALATASFVVKYEIGGETFGCFPKWHKHQFINGKEQKSIIPPPTIDGLAQGNKQLDLLDDSTREPHVSHTSSTREPHEQHVNGTCDPRQTSYVPTEGKGREGKRIKSGAEQSSSPPILELPLVKVGTTHTVRSGDIAKWEQVFPGLDVRYHLRKMLLWLENNPKRRKTRRGIDRFVTNWLAEEYEKLAAQKPHTAQPARPTASQRMAAAKGRE